MKRIFFLFTLWLSINSLVAQIHFRGQIVDKMKKPVAGVTVHLEKTPHVSYTNNQGYFELNNIPEGKKYSMRIGGGDYEVIRLQVNESNDNMYFVLKDAVVNLEQVVVTGTGTQHRLKDSPVPIEVFTKRDLDRSGLTDMNAFLSFSSASFNTSSSAMGSSITLNGLRNRHILILIDGQRLYGDVMGDSDLSRIDLSTVKQIEVLKGAASSLYGSDAMGGVINIITEKPKVPISSNFFTQYAKYGQLTYRGNVNLKLGQLSSQSSFSIDESDGWQLNPNERIIELDKKDKTKIAVDETKPTSKLASGKFKASVFNQQLRWDATQKLQLSARLNLYKKENPRPYDSYDYDFIYTSSTLGVGARYIIKRGAYLYFDAYNDNYDYSRKYNKEIADKKTKNVTHRFNEIVLAKRQQLYNAHLKGVFDINKYNKLTTGIDVIREKLINDESLPEPKQVGASSLYMQDEVNINNSWQVVAGLRFTYHEKFKDRFLPKLSLMYKPMESINLRASYASGFRAPDLMELYYEKETSKGISAGNVNLKPELSNYFSLNSEYVNRYFTLSVSAYQNDIKNLIERTEVPLTENDKKIGITQRLMYENTSSARVRGVETSLNSYIGSGFSVGGSYAFTDAKNIETGMPLSKSYRHGVTTNLNWVKDWKYSRLNLNLAGTYQSERYEKTLHGNAPAFQLWKFVTRYTIHARQGGLIVEPGFTVDNIFNYRDNRPFGAYYSTLSPGRTLVASILVSFK